ncbi:MAG: MoaD/ThiS family protein [Acidimicrobiia bacterium]|nr:MoaD/ThiS family protein [Acidimicrobiia bacterium]MBT8192116.1 MoaD/ThiS family protein [Acidimicrobiia bacterium]NNF89668.1 MoaD/ThiS family protein [Acidimicrobiia bacterium]NNL14163.1 MoaD/ThiS family protein [Acidimicrobiia bacterium]NNL98700.1 MoaD/ThiS family protein [Acidimicrobiia bacterium]
MKVVLRNPRRELEIEGDASVKDVLKRLDIIPETVLVIRDGELLLKTDLVTDADTIELRPVISGGSTR